MDQLELTKADRDKIADKASDLDLFFGDEDSDSDAGWDLSYSGRGMYGKDCVGIVVAGPTQLAMFAIAVTEALGSDFAYDLLRNTRSDNLGYSTIYYWPNCTDGS